MSHRRTDIGTVTDERIHTLSEARKTRECAGHTVQVTTGRSHVKVTTGRDELKRVVNSVTVTTAQTCKHVSVLPTAAKERKTVTF